MRMMRGFIAAARDDSSCRRSRRRRRIRPATIRGATSSPAATTPASRSATCAGVVRDEAGGIRHGARPDVHQLRPGVRHGNYVYQGNFAGFTIWDMSDPAKPGDRRRPSKCITSQGDPTIYGNLLFLSAEGAGNRNDCAKGGVQDPKDHMAGVRIFDVSNPTRAEAREERADLQRLAHAHARPEPEGQGHHLHLRVGQPGRAAGDGAGRVQERHGPGRPDELALPARHHQGAARPPRAGRGRSRARASSPASMARAECKQFCAPVDPRRQAADAASRPRAGSGDADRSAQLPRRDGVSGDEPARRRVLQHSIARRHLEPREAGAARRARPTRTTSSAGTRRRSATTARRSIRPTSGAAARARCARRRA